jgi:hypothetical protein
MRRLIAAGAIALLTLAAVPLASAVVAPPLTTTIIDGSVFVTENESRSWYSRFEVRATAGAVDFGYLEIDGLPGTSAGEIHQFLVESVELYTTTAGARGAILHMQECRIIPSEACFSSDYQVSDGSAVGQDDTFLDNLGWTVTAGNISIREVAADNPVVRVGHVKVAAGHRSVDVDLRSQGGLGSGPRCFAELQTYRSGVWVTACRPNYPVAGKARIYLNKAVSKATYVAWDVTSN